MTGCPVQLEDDLDILELEEGAQQRPLDLEHPGRRAIAVRDGAHVGVHGGWRIDDNRSSGIEPQAPADTVAVDRAAQAIESRGADRHDGGARPSVALVKLAVALPVDEIDVG